MNKLTYFLSRKKESVTRLIHGISNRMDTMSGYEMILCGDELRAALSELNNVYRELAKAYELASKGA